MPFKEISKVTLRREFVSQMLQPCANKRELCRRYGVTSRTGYKWLRRFLKGGVEALEDESRRPKGSPNKTAAEVEKEVLKLRAKHPAWGGRKLKRRLSDMGKKGLPAPSTITEILRRNGKLDAAESTKHKAFQRFEYAQPNQLWQMDFKGHFPLGAERCHPLTVLDDHSRFSLALFACRNERTDTVKGHLTTTFRRYGLPKAILADNGSPWGSDSKHVYTPLTVWMIRMGIRVIHGRPFHPQTQGKDERFHRTMNAELLTYEKFTDFDHCQTRFDHWRDIYNHERPHEALGMDVPGTRYSPSKHCFPEALPAIEYAPGDAVRKVQAGGFISYRGREFKVSKAFRGQPVAIRTTTEDGRFDVVFCNHTIAVINLIDHDS